MRALVISGGGSKGAFAGGVAQYLIEEMGNDYDLFLGTSTGSLLISHLALNKTQKIKEVYTSVNQKSIFSNRPFLIKRKHGQDQISIDHFNVIRNFMRGKKTFGESENLKKLILNTITKEEFEAKIYEFESNLSDLFAKSSDLEKVIHSNFKELKYEKL